MVTNRSFLPLASVFIICLCLFSTYGNAAASSYDEKPFTQSVAEAASTNPADSNNLPGPGFPISIGGGGNSNGGGGWLRIWTPLGWITIGGGGDNHGGGGGGGFQPFVPPPSPPKPNPVTPNPPNPTPQHPSNPVTPNPPNRNPTPGSSRPQLPPWLAPFFNGGGKNPSPSSPSNPPPNPSNPKIPPWLAPYIGSDGRLHEPPSPPPVTPKWLAPYIGKDGRLHLPDSPSRPIPKWLAPYIGPDKPPHTSTPAHLAENSIGSTRAAASGFETSKTYVREKHDHYQCWSQLEKIEKCVNEVLTAFSSRKFEVLGSACCSAIEKMNKECHAKTIGNFHDHFFSASVHRHCSAN